MARSKLTDADKLEVIRLYRETTKTTPKLAEEFEVSASTITRILKSGIDEQEYVALSQAKRRGEGKAELEPELVLVPAQLELPEIALTTEAVAVPTPEELPIKPVLLQEMPEIVVAVLPEVVSEDISPPIPALADVVLSVPNTFAVEVPFYAPPVKPELEVLPYEQMTLPAICYIVVDRWAELIARPLREFNFLDNIPPQEQEAIALPVYDNHRWAKRYSNRFQRIVRVETKLFDLTKSHLMERGITRFLVGKQVFALDLTSGPLKVITPSVGSLGDEEPESLEGAQDLEEGEFDSTLDESVLSSFE